MLLRLRLLASTIAFSALAVPATALGADAYVDRDTGSGTACTQAVPCATIAAGIAAAGASDEIRVDDSPGAYAEAVTLGDGKSLIAFEVVGGAEGDTIIDGGATRAIGIEASGAGTIQGFNLRGDQGGVHANSAGVTITGNTFDEPTERGFADVNVQTTDPMVISGNTFIAPAGDVLSTGVFTDDGTDPTVSGNTFSGHTFAVTTDGPGNNTVVEGNQMTNSEGGHFLSSAIFVEGDSAPSVVGNTISNPNGGSRGIFVLENTDTPAPTSATLARNQVLGFPTGVQVQETRGAVSLEGDLIANSSSVGLRLNDVGPLGPDDADVSATNLTLASNEIDIHNSDADLTLGSSIVEDAVDVSGESTTATCSITFSRGPSTTPGGSGCADFQTTASPGFADAPGGDFSLADGSAMVDAGDPAVPTAAEDYDGDARVLDGNLDSTARRDIGADELMPRPQLTSTDPPSPSTANTVNVIGVAEGTATVNLFASGDCASAVVDSGSAATFASPGLEATVPANSSTTFSAMVDGPTGTSACSTVNVTYVEDSAGPVITIGSPPAAAGSDTTPTVGFSANEAATFSCEVDGGAAASCTSPATFGPLADGAHTITVTGTDPLGNEGPAATASFTIDTAPPPAAAITGRAKAKLKPGKKRALVRFAFSSEPGAGFECSLDGGAFAACAPPLAVRLKKGKHVLRVRARDAAGNLGPATAKTVRVKPAKRR